MRFWDSSAVVAFIVDEPASDRLRLGYGSDREIVAWWATRVECASAFARLLRMGELTAEQVELAFAQLDAMAASWREIEPLEEIRDTARRMLRTHELRAADALQLAAAHAAAEGRPSTLEVVTLDDRLREAASKEGFRLVALGHAE